MYSGVTVGVSFIEESCICVVKKNPVTSLIDDALRRIGSNII